MIRRSRDLPPIMRQLLSLALVVSGETAKALEEMNVPYRVIELDARKADMVKNSILGDASHKAVLERAGIHNATAVVITSHNDESNIYQIIHCRKLRPDIQAITLGFPAS